jgi:NADH dehydrogenase FAD-containing subunit
VIIGDRKIKSRTALGTAGVTPSRLAQSLDTPLDRRGRIIVEPDLSIPGHPNAFPVGDIDSFTGEISDGHGPAHACGRRSGGIVIDHDPSAANI